jgi:hypothetical protein
MKKSLFFFCFLSLSCFSVAHANQPSSNEAVTSYVMCEKIETPVNNSSVNRVTSLNSKKFTSTYLAWKYEGDSIWSYVYKTNSDTHDVHAIFKQPEGFSCKAVIETSDTKGTQS